MHKHNHYCHSRFCPYLQILSVFTFSGKNRTGGLCTATLRVGPLPGALLVRCIRLAYDIPGLLTTATRCCTLYGQAEIVYFYDAEGIVAIISTKQRFSIDHKPLRFVCRTSQCCSCSRTNSSRLSSRPVPFAHKNSHRMSKT